MSKQNSKKGIKKNIKTRGKKKATSLVPKKVQDTSLSTLLTFTQSLALEAGDLLLKYEKKVNRLEVTHKEAQGVASSADLASEKLIIKEIKKRFPEHAILSEESAYFQGGLSPEDFAAAPYCWVIDPLDGTHNFLNGLDYFAVCIGLARFGIMQVGVVYRPSTQELYYASAGSGAFKVNKGNKRSKPLSLFKESNSKSSTDCLFSTGFASERQGPIEEEFAIFKRVFKKARGVRRIGSAALDLCYVASGIYDGFWERGLAPWDVAAASLICQESGTKLTEFNGQEFHVFSPTVLAARTPLHGEIQKIVCPT